MVRALFYHNDELFGAPRSTNLSSKSYCIMLCRKIYFYLTNGIQYLYVSHKTEANASDSPQRQEYIFLIYIESFLRNFHLVFHRVRKLVCF